MSRSLLDLLQEQELRPEPEREPEQLPVQEQELLQEREPEQLPVPVLLRLR